MPHHAPSLYNKNAAAFETDLPLLASAFAANNQPPLVFVGTDRLKTACRKIDCCLGRGCHAFCQRRRIGATWPLASNRILFLINNYATSPPDRARQVPRQLPAALLAEPLAVRFRPLALVRFSHELNC
jgi:hypothetical protein